MRFNVGDKVYVNSTYPDAYLVGTEGIVNTIDKYNGIGVRIFGMVNPMTVSGLFWFVESNLIRAQKRNESVNLFAIKNVYFNDPVTVVMWKDGSKTIVRCGENEEYDPEKGLAMAISKKALGNKGNYYDEFKKWLPRETCLCHTCKNFRIEGLSFPKCIQCIFSSDHSKYDPIVAKK